ncbi:hypothetical protein ACFX13_019146 [Malus domestica]|uniref:Uncharacterized protein n=1 Tax=Malus domestica TaxID=3750 RepID=A0A498HVF5_MALDO|nr:hypothetical protein DVH24_030147 [Malus domestica]
MANSQANFTIHTHKFSIVELASFIDLTPWHRFGFTATNAAILEAVEGYSVVHIVDLSLTHCMQIPTLVDAIASRQDGMSRNIILEFRVIPSSYTDGFANLIEQLRVQNLVYAESGEALVVNCHMMLHYISEEALTLPAINPNPSSSGSTSSYAFDVASSSSSSSLRTVFLKELGGLDPTIVVLVNEDVDLTSNNLVCRLRSAFNYLWIPYDTVDTFLPRGSKQRQWYEADVCWKIENVIAYEGFQRVERLEPKCRWVQRMRNANFRSVSFGEDAVSEVKAMLDEHAAGWGLKREEEDVVLTLKGHNVVFATAWMPA